VSTKAVGLQVKTRLLAFQQHYEQLTTPFEWKFTKNDLNTLLKRITVHHDANLALTA
jgi:hypothetical protein